MVGWTADEAEILLLTTVYYGADEAQGRFEAYNVDNKTTRLVTTLYGTVNTPIGWHPMGRFLPIVHTENESIDIQLFLVDVIQ